MARPLPSALWRDDHVPAVGIADEEPVLEPFDDRAGATRSVMRHLDVVDAETHHERMRVAHFFGGLTVVIVMDGEASAVRAEPNRVLFGLLDVETEDVSIEGRHLSTTCGEREEIAQIRPCAG